MSEGTDSPVEVDVPRALQIIELVENNEEGDTTYEFNAREDNLEHIMNKIPKNLKVAVVSVVGNFRTGKSFLLTFMLRYLRNKECSGVDWQTADGNSLTEGNANVDSASEHESFEWRAGHERMTTGIWMYSEPFFHTAANGEELAVLVVDTQGLFDNEASMLLTSCIFGLSTLMSSHQIYNVKENISEDHLQHLALFSEYGRMALSGDGEEDEEDDKKDDAKAASKSTKEEEDDDKVKKPVHKAFQRLEFLVRDWADEDTLNNDKFMNEYIRDTIFKTKKSKDLRETRDQITSCFENINCFMLPHPGLAVTKKNYDGTIEGGSKKGLEDDFRTSLDIYMRRVFGINLEPKRIHGRSLTAPELLVYIKTYVALFKDSNKFPEAKTVLQATAEANTANACSLAMKKYIESMDNEMGPNVTRYLNPMDAKEHHIACYTGSLELFDQLANMGLASNIQKVRLTLIEDINELHNKYISMNSGRNPMKNIEPYLLPIMIAFSAWLLGWFTKVCSGTSVCDNAADLFSHIYVVCIFLMLLAGMGNIKAGFAHVKTIMPLLLGNKNKVA
jgi:atlastin